MFAYSHAMINPLIYITFNDNFKKSFKRFICCSDEEITYEYSNRKYIFFTIKNRFIAISKLSAKRACLVNISISPPSSNDSSKDKHLGSIYVVLVVDVFCRFLFTKFNLV